MGCDLEGQHRYISLHAAERSERLALTTWADDFVLVDEQVEVLQKMARQANDIVQEQ